MTKTVKVRIFVAVDPLGHWASVGWSELTDATAKMEVESERLDDPAFHWITAEVPIPEATDIAGVVE